MLTVWVIFGLVVGNRNDGTAGQFRSNLFKVDANLWCFLFLTFCWYWVLFVGNPLIELNGRVDESGDEGHFMLSLFSAELGR